MKQIYLAAITLTLIIFTSCTQVNSTGEKTITQGEDTVSDVNISLSKMDAVEELSNVTEESTELVFKAGGTEPGWSAEFYKDRIFIVADYGTDKITIKRNNIDLNQKTDLKIDIKSSLVDCITIENKSCTNAAGEKESRSVKLVYGGKLYTGCGSFIK
jgi:uncharacterized membrane protein